MPLRDATGLIEDEWTPAEPGAPLGARSLLALEDAEAREAELGGIDPRSLGLRIANDAERARLRPWLHRVGLIAVLFPAFSDGRGFSLGKWLREQGFAGRLRAEGPVIADQWPHLRGCGFDEVLIPEALAARQPEAQWRAAEARIGLAYQQGWPGRRSISDARREGGR